MNKMELVPIPKPREKNSNVRTVRNSIKSAKYLLDENCGKDANHNPEYLFFRNLVSPGTPDWLVLEKAREHNLIINTRDKGLVLRAISEGDDIVYQTEWGDRFHVKAKLIQQGCVAKKYNVTSKEKRLKKIAQYQYSEYYFL